VRRLIIRPGALGDFLVSLPALQCLRSSYLEVWTASAHLPLVQFADRVRSIASTGLDLVAVAEPPASLWEALRGFDSIVSWYGANRPEFRQAVNGLPFTFLPALPVNAHLHAIDFYLSQVRSVTECQSAGIPSIVTTAQRDVNMIIIHPFSGSPRKNWPLENFRELAAQLAQESAIYWCRGPEDPPLEGAVQMEDLYQLACWLARARLFIGNDSGVTHLAAAVGTPVLALFGPTDPAVWAPRGPRVQIGRFTSLQP
jgi:ADP-heptose:LPS heptosyltransferase